MRMILWFVLNFFIFGLIFYAIWIYSPEQFHVLVSWAAKAFDYVKDLISQLMGHTSSAPAAPAVPKALLLSVWPK